MGDGFWVVDGLFREMGGCNKDEKCPRLSFNLETTAFNALPVY
jgi:hypothetical protein